MLWAICVSFSACVNYSLVRLPILAIAFNVLVNTVWSLFHITRWNNVSEPGFKSSLVNCQDLKFVSTWFVWDCCRRFLHGKVCVLNSLVFGSPYVRVMTAGQKRCLFATQLSGAWKHSIEMLRGHCLGLEFGDVQSNKCRWKKGMDISRSQL